MFRPPNGEPSTSSATSDAPNVQAQHPPLLNFDSFNVNGMAPVNPTQGKANSAAQFDPIADQIARAQMFASMFSMPYVYPTPQQMYGATPFAAMQLQATYANLLRKATAEVAVHSQNLYKMYQSSDSGYSPENKKPVPREVKVNGELVTHWSCWFCGKEFSLRRNCARHQKTHDDKTKRHRCEECGVCYRRKSDLRTHLRVHSGEKPYECKLCFKEFARISDLRSHERRHSMKDHVCSICTGSFLKKSHFASHDCKAIQKKAVTEAEDDDLAYKKKIRRTDLTELDEESTDCSKLKAGYIDNDSESKRKESGAEESSADKTQLCVAPPMQTNKLPEAEATPTTTTTTTTTTPAAGANVLPVFQPSDTAMGSQTSPLFMLPEDESQNWLPPISQSTGSMPFTL